MYKNRLSRKEILEASILRRTRFYEGSGVVKHDKDLMKSHYLLARIYSREGDSTKAIENLIKAEEEFLNICNAFIPHSIYLTNQRTREEEDKIEKTLNKYRENILEIGFEIGYDCKNLLTIITNPRKNEKEFNLV